MVKMRLVAAALSTGLVTSEVLAQPPDNQPPGALIAMDAESDLYSRAVQYGCAGLRGYLVNYPLGRYRDDANARIAELKCSLPSVWDTFPDVRPAAADTVLEPPLLPPLKAPEELRSPWTFAEGTNAIQVLAGQDVTIEKSAEIGENAAGWALFYAFSGMRQAEKVKPGTSARIKHVVLVAGTPSARLVDGSLMLTLNLDTPPSGAAPSTDAVSMAVLLGD